MTKLANLQIGIEWYELLLWLFFVAIGAGFLYFYKTFNDNPKNKYLLQGYFTKMIGGLFFALVYIYYYKGGDTILYFLGTTELNEVLVEDPSTYFRLMFSSFEEYKKILIEKYLWIGTGKSAEEWFMLRATSIFSFIGLNTYLGATFFFSLLSFFGSILMSRIMNDIKPGFERIVFGINFLMPSTILWGSGLLKDTFTLFCFSVLCYYLYKIIYNSYPIFRAIAIVLIPGFIIFNLKPYILICFLPWIFISFFYKIINKNENPVAKFLILPYLLIIFSVGLYFASTYMLESSSEYKLDQIYKRIEGFKSWHTKLEGSAYTLGEMEYSQLGLLKKFPQAVNVTLFRPYLWESSNFFSLLTSIESSLFFVYFLYTLFRSKLNFFVILSKNEFLFGALFFVIFFAFAIGVSAFNFGALVRFKIPLVAIFGFLLFYVVKQVKENKLNLNY